MGCIAGKLSERRKAVLGAAHPDTLKAALYYADSLAERKDFSAAAPLMKQTLLARLDVLNEEISVGADPSRWTMPLISCGSIDPSVILEARQAYRAEVAKRSSAGGQRDRRTLAAISALAALSSDKPAEAQAFYQTVYSNSVSGFGIQSALAMYAARDLSRIMDFRGNHDDATTLL